MNDTKQRAERTTSSRRRERPARQPRRSKRKAYVPFSMAAPEQGRDVVVAHLNWLLANLDYFAQEGRATLQTATRALHQDLLLARMIEPVHKKSEKQQFVSLEKISRELADATHSAHKKFEQARQNREAPDATAYWQAAWTALSVAEDTVERFHRVLYYQ